MAFDYVLYDLSYTNLIMLGAVLPSYGGKDEKGGKNKEQVRVDDPRNNDKVREIIESLR